MNTQTRTVYCARLKKHAPGLEDTWGLPPGELGDRIYQSISQEAWTQWMNRQTMIINEYRLKLGDAKARAFLQKEMEGFLFAEETSAPPAGYIPPDAEGG